MVQHPNIIAERLNLYPRDHVMISSSSLPPPHRGKRRDPKHPKLLLRLQPTTGSSYVKGIEVPKANRGIQRPAGDERNNEGSY
jgi:hypothetical protein